MEWGGEGEEEITHILPRRNKHRVLQALTECPGSEPVLSPAYLFDPMPLDDRLEFSLRWLEEPELVDDIMVLQAC